MGAANLFINSGTQNAVPVDAIGTVNYPVMKLDVGGLGTSTPFTTVPTLPGTPLLTIGTTGGSVWGTLVAAAGVGTKQYISGVDIVVTSGTMDVAVTYIGVGGSAGAGVLVRGAFPAGGGIAKTFTPIVASATNGTLSYWLNGPGTASINVQYWQGV